MEVEGKMKKIIIVLLIYSILSLNVILRSEIMFADEVYYAGVAKHIQKTRGLPAFYKRLIELPSGEIQKGDPISRPIMLSLIFSILPEMVWKFVPFVIGFVTLILFYHFGKKFLEENTILFGLSLLALTPLFLEHSILGYQDLLFGTFSFSCLMVYLLGADKLNLKYAVASGILLGLGILTKEIGFVVIIPFFILTFFEKEEKRYAFKYFLVFMLVSLSIGSLFYIRNYFLYNSPFPNFDIPFFNPSYPPVHQAVDYSFEAGKLIRILDPIVFVYFSPLFLFLMLCVYILSVRVKKEPIRYLIFWCFLSFSFTFLVSPTMDFRYFLFLLIPMCYLAGWFLKEVVNTAIEFSNNEKLGQLITYAILIVIIFNGTVTSYLKADAILEVRTNRENEFFNGLFEYIQEKTPEDSVIMTPFSVEIPYFTDRNAVWLTSYAMGELPDFINNKSEAVFDYMEKYKVDYLIIQHINQETGFREDNRISLPRDWVQMMFDSQNTIIVYEEAESETYLLKINYD